MEDPDNCALRADGTLKDADEINWVNSPSDERPDPFSFQVDTAPTPSGGAPDTLAASSTPPGLSDKAPAEKVAGRRRIIPSTRLSNGSRENSVVARIAGELLY